MVGYSKWSKDQHSKGPLDFKRGAAFRKLVRKITVAVRYGTRHPSGNPRRQSVLELARAQGRPQKNIERAELQNYFTQPESTAVAAVVETVARRSQIAQARAADGDLRHICFPADPPEETLVRYSI